MASVSSGDLAFRKADRHKFKNVLFSRRQNYDMTKYSDSDLKRLCSLTGNMCAFPNCQVKVVTDYDIIVGEICHIEGEKPGSARYNPKMTNKERNSFDNLVVFCSTHHTEVDKNPSRYPVPLLKKMKTTHENKYRKNPYNMPDQLLNILKVAVNYDEYSLERIHNLLKIFKKLRNEQTKKLWFDHIKYMLNGLTIPSPIRQDKQGAILTVFNEIHGLKPNESIFQEVILRFLDKIPEEIRPQYIERLRVYIEGMKEDNLTDTNFPRFYKHLRKSEVESLEFLIDKAGDLNKDQFDLLLSNINIDFKAFAQNERVLMDFERRLWEMLDNAEKKREATIEENEKDRYNNIYQNIETLVKKFI